MLFLTSPVRAGDPITTAAQLAGYFFRQSIAFNCPQDEISDRASKKAITGRFLCSPDEIHPIARPFNVIADRF